MELPVEALARSVSGRNLSGETLGEEIGAGPTLLVFLRHLG
jgi:hypothetical protein